jgi:hypothetical protein
MENIKIFDNFLNDEDLSKIIENISTFKWNFGHISIRHQFSPPFWVNQLEDNPFFSTYLKSKIEVATGKKFILNKVYANGQTFGQDGGFHQDDIREDCFTFCLYINSVDINEIDFFGGYFQFKIPELKHFIVSVEPHMNRGILFPSNYFHKGNAFSRYGNDIRISIVWKFQEIQTDYSTQMVNENVESVSPSSDIAVPKEDVLNVEESTSLCKNRSYGPIILFTPPYNNHDIVER